MPFKDPVKQKEYDKLYYIKYRRQWDLAHPKYKRQWNLTHRGYMKEYNRQYHLARPNYNHQYYLAHPNKEYCVEHNRELRFKVLERLGNKCIRCGIMDWRVLQIDHINGGGNKEMKNIGMSTFHRKIINMSEEELKQKYQLLCANCNWIKKYERNEN